MSMETSQAKSEADLLDPYPEVALFAHERAFFQSGYQKIAGIDEAGRGPLAGPVVAACCLVLPGFKLPGFSLKKGTYDSKALPPEKRRKLFYALKKSPYIRYGIGIISHEIIDQINIYQATILAMQEAVNQLVDAPDFLLIDGLEFKDYIIPSKKIIGGDNQSFSIGAASILAKETRDDIMREYHKQFPEYGFFDHKGYGTKKHLDHLKKWGPCPIHRKSYAPVSTFSFNKENI